MQAFVAIATAALLAIHTVFGCCWHHAHQCQDGRAVACSEEAPCCHHHGSDSKQQEQPRKCKVECEGTCTYVAPQKVRIAAPQAVGFDVLAVPQSLSDHGLQAAVFWGPGRSPPDWAPPLRTHLVHQVLLN